MVLIGGDFSERRKTYSICRLLSIGGFLETITINILNWHEKKYIREDLVKPWWFKFDTEIFINPRFYGISPKEVAIFSYILSMACLQKCPSATINLAHAKIYSFSKKDFDDFVNNFNDLFSSDRNPIVIRPDADRNPTLQYNTIQNSTEQKNDQTFSNLLKTDSTTDESNMIHNSNNDQEIIKVDQQDNEKDADTRLNAKERAAIETLEFLNSQSGKKFKPVKSNLNHINARLDEGYTIEDLKYVVESKTKQWINDDKMYEYLRPSTLFCPKNFDAYLNASNKTKEDPLWFNNFFKQFEKDVKNE
jgi:uncharacterized phage protein (TIGR02220 family)